MCDEVEIIDEGALRIIRLNRPDKANALTEPMLQALIAAVDCPARALIFTGAGRIYCAGADLDAARAGLAVSDLWNRFSNAVAAFPGLTIAALNASAVGGSLGHVMACDLRIGVPDGKIFYPVLKHGFTPPTADLPRMMRLIGPARAKMIILGAQRIPFPEAQSWGFLDRVEDDPLEAARALSQPALEAKDGHFAALKSLFNL